MANRKGIPPQIKTLTGRNEFSYKILWEKSTNKLTLHSYVVNTKSKGKKNVLALSTLPPILGITKDDGKEKPAILKFYDFTKGGTDIIDQRIGSYTVNSKSNKWTTTVFSYILDTARVNAQTVHSHLNNKNPRETNSFEFALELARNLCIPHIKERNNHVINLNKKVKSKIIAIVGEATPAEEVIQQAPSNKKRRCYICYESGAHHNMLNPTSRSCRKCLQYCCRKHSKTCNYCDHCYEDNRE
jgi:hypothetical protein